MNIQHQKILKKECPKLFTLLALSPEERVAMYKPFEPIALGIDCGDGWFNIILELSKQLEALNENLVAVQIKEKYGGLRFYLLSTTDRAEELIREAEEKCEATCEVCGEAGVNSEKGHWYSTRCEKHV